MLQRKLVAGVGLNDANYPVTRNKVINGKTKQIWMCPFYKKWKDMLIRCYSKRENRRHPTYIKCTVCEEWLTFSNFKAWMETQDWEGKQLDKDLKVGDNLLYSPETCCFVSARINSFLCDSAAARGQYPIGVYWHKRDLCFSASCSNLFTGKTRSLGYFSDSQDAHKAWASAKLEFARQLADFEEDKEIGRLLVEKFEKILDKALKTDYVNTKSNL